MTVKLSISVPDDIAAYLQTHGNVSAAVVNAVAPLLPEARYARQLADADAYAEYAANRTPEHIDEDHAIAEASMDDALAGTEW